MTTPKIPHPEILLEQGAVLVLQKPGGLLTQGPPGIDSLELRTKSFLKVRDEKPGKVYLGVPHRLDRPVSGVIVVTKNVRAANRISAQIRERTVTKTYWAVVEGNPDQSRGEFVDWMRKLPDEAKSAICESDHPDAKKAVLNFKILAQTRTGSQSRTLVEIELETGRTHQIRLQFGSRGLPIVGDELYGATSKFGPATPDRRKRWISLHARRLAFEHPIEKTPVDVSAPIPECWEVFDEFRSLLFRTDKGIQ